MTSKATVASTHDLFGYARPAHSTARTFSTLWTNRLQLPPRARARYACVPRSRPSHTELWPHSCGCHNALAIISAARTSARRPAVIVVTTASLRAASVFRRSSPPHSEHPHHHPSCDDGRLLHSRSFYIGLRDRSRATIARGRRVRGGSLAARRWPLAPQARDIPHLHANACDASLALPAGGVPRAWHWHRHGRTFSASPLEVPT